MDGGGAINFWQLNVLVHDIIRRLLQEVFKRAWKAKNPKRPWNDLDKGASGRMFLQREADANNRALDSEKAKDQGKKSAFSSFKVEDYYHKMIEKGDTTKWDVTLLCKVLEWSNQKFLDPRPVDLTRDDIANARKIRNDHLGHTCSTEVDASVVARASELANKMAIAVRPLDPEIVVSSLLEDKTQRLGQAIGVVTELANGAAA
eukprot:CAMPEP_0173396192 /NCGR_PEP_ID=MMETSP1356-20130122/34763_1 /TAXON_ID=77927 ORGANISM="Hemiselmis virescens, Strain PCC157" /NCGR_SAMPLE_ID=MMETSP1356 /ASSEMBLY_ACC=CAM_ASM_000847 /LENGTH=203 /DNA_ID=CAMNT_0014355153 /DNA_START=11 /DNA_END=618 /DNA_ORIENTATION=+